MVSPPEGRNIVGVARHDMCDDVAGKKRSVNSASAVLTGQRSCPKLRAPW